MAPSRGDDWEVPSRLVQTLDAHTGPVHVVRYNHGAKYCLSGGGDRTIRLWNPTSGKEIKRYEGHGREVLALDIAFDNAKFASSGGDKLVFVWDVASGTIVRRLQGHFGKINAVAFSQDAQILATAGFDAKVMLWDMRAVMKEPLQTLKEANNSITSLSLPPTTEILSSSSDGHIRTYDLRLGKYVEDLIGSPCYSVLPSINSPRESMLVSSEDAIRIFDRSSGTCLQTFTGVKGPKARWGYGESKVVSGDEKGRVWCWNVLDAKAVDSDPKPVHKKAITWLEVNPTGKEMITASMDGTIKVWAE
ncbi:hypothetical protein TREMEDRAFT_69967 [Tremella mesenterica DSM 1558]|uniref:uncharacterized protein n=1 Tax=Tremella mesenterica (strain ATCC 24925 / CBS 8224 / DSM 1558 / NBRC 9311 / NRRL Y-6157 / RJB 2259-6 / UBC 559-6) TaxID=578456 RepID=UPI0003F49C7A|nr:uncharacterized protein TREMEDRAFT_69967 [Tremella mesenterica DSM 1558]EIW67067.1 hypothetical protein TREMEDRAFT_69967 [Tremella mesenterica DSM 1558]